MNMKGLGGFDKFINENNEALQAIYNENGLKYLAMCIYNCGHIDGYNKELEVSEDILASMQEENYELEVEICKINKMIKNENN